MTGVDDLRRFQRIMEATAQGPSELRVRSCAELELITAGRVHVEPGYAGGGQLGVERLFGMPVILDPRMSPGAFALLDDGGNLLRLFVVPVAEPASVVEDDLDDGQLEWVLIACAVLVATVWAVCLPALLLGRGF